MAKHRARYTSGPKKGQFKPKSKAKARKKKSGKRKSRKAGRRIGARKGNRKMAKKRKSRRSRRGSVTSGNARARVLLSTAAYGYLKEQTQVGPQMVAMLAKVPGADSLGVDAVAAIGMHYLAKHVRFGRKYIDACATGLAGHIGIKLGQSGFNMSAIKGPADWGSGEELAGALDPADFLDSEPEL